MIALIDYGMGNLRSVEKALQKAGASPRRVEDPRALSRARAIVLPGVGAFGDAVRELRRRGLYEAVRRAVREGVPYLGLCLGLQLLFERSEETPGAKGLGLLSGKVVRFGGRLKVPHMGWNSLRIERPEGGRLLRGVPEGTYYYFVHSYYAVPEDPRACLSATTQYGRRICAAVEYGNIYATQFHPEKSQSQGLKLLRNFVRASS